MLIESTVSRPEERHRCFQLLRNHLDDLPSLRLETYENGGFESLVALPRGVDRPSILFCGHLDVVEHMGSRRYRSELRDGRIYGPGTGDMKGALAIILTLFHQVLEGRPNAPIGLAITSDEEQGGEHGARYLVEGLGLEADFVIIPDGGSIDRITIEEKGILHARLLAQGHAAHAARPWLGQNPVLDLLDALQGLQDRFRRLQAKSPSSEYPSSDDNHHWYPTCVPTGLETPNEGLNSIPEYAAANLDIRFPPPHTVASLEKMLASELGPNLSVATIISAEPTHLDPDPRFIEATEAVLGRPAVLARVSGGSDARFFRLKNTPVLLSRPLVGNLHSHDEWIDIRSMLDYYRICQRYLDVVLH